MITRVLCGNSRLQMKGDQNENLLSEHFSSEEDDIGDEMTPVVEWKENYDADQPAAYGQVAIEVNHRNEHALSALRRRKDQMSPYKSD